MSVAGSRNQRGLTAPTTCVNFSFAYHQKCISTALMTFEDLTKLPDPRAFQVFLKLLFKTY